MRGSAAPSSSTIFPVPSGELSSITSTSACGTNLWISAMSAATFPASLYVASETRIRGSAPRLGRGFDPPEFVESMRRYLLVSRSVRFAIFLGYDPT